MKNLIMSGAAAVALLSAVTAADARPVRVSESWCLNVSEGRGGAVYRCNYASYGQCMASRTANGEWCMQNPELAYRGYYPAYR